MSAIQGPAGYVKDHPSGVVGRDLDPVKELRELRAYTDGLGIRVSTVLRQKLLNIIRTQGEEIEQADKEIERLRELALERGREVAVLKADLAVHIATRHSGEANP